jgi:precorrin-2 dehydrogenase/sirohydrochlorin ferrochelatase
LIVDLNLAEKHVIVVGGGIEGVRKVKGLLGQNCKITVISERMNSYLDELSQQNKIEIVKMKIKNADILDNYQDIFLVLAATDNKELNRKIIEKGRSMMSFVYAADDPQVSDFSYASIINIEGVMQVALRIKAERILRRIIKQSDIENTKLQEYARMAARPKIKTVMERKRFLYSIFNDKNIQNLINENKIDEAKAATIELLNHWSDFKNDPR